MRACFPLTGRASAYQAAVQPRTRGITARGWRKRCILNICVCIKTAYEMTRMRVAPPSETIALEILLLTRGVQDRGVQYETMPRI